MVGRLDDVQAELGLDDVADLAGLERERRLLELLRHLAAAEEIEVAAAGLADFLVGVLVGELGEVLPGLGAREHRLGLLADRGLVLALDLEEDVAGADLLGRRELLLVLLVVLLRRPAAEICWRVAHAPAC